MPELPEVETIARSLRAELVGREISSAQLLWPKTLAAPSEAEFMAQIRGQRIRDVSRRGKFLQLELQPGIDGQPPLTLFIHLRMSGDMYVKPGDYVPEKHDRLILALTTPPAGPAHAIKEGEERERIYWSSTTRESSGGCGSPQTPAK